MDPSEKKMPSMDRKIRVTCDVIYSDGGKVGPENLWKLYSIALTPFVLGVPAVRVTMLLAPAFLNRNDCVRRTVECHAFKWLPEGYRDYFWAAYQNAVDIHGISVAPVAHLRVILGQGYHDYRRGGHIRSTKTNIPFSSFGPGSIFTIIDVCCSPCAVAVFSGTYPTGDPRPFDGRAFSRTQHHSSQLHVTKPHRHGAFVLAFLNKTSTATKVTWRG